MPADILAPSAGRVSAKISLMNEIWWNSSTMFHSLWSVDAKWQHRYPDGKVHVANMGPIWGRQDPGGPHVGPMNLAIWVCVNKNPAESLL